MLQVVATRSVNLSLIAQSINRICPNRAYAIERITGFKMADHGAKEVVAADKSDCANKCLNERLFTCRAASFDRTTNKCLLSQSNRHVSPNSFKAQPEFEYMENMCLKRKYRKYLHDIMSFVLTFFK